MCLVRGKQFFSLTSLPIVRVVLGPVDKHLESVERGLLLLHGEGSSHRGLAAEETIFKALTSFSSVP